MKSDNAYDHAWQHAPRNDDGARVHDALVELVAANIDFDVDKARLGLARRIVARRMRPGQTAPAGAVVFPGMEMYAYEPDRLIADNDGNVIENSRAKVDYKIAESERAQTDLEKAGKRQSREKREADHFSRWAAIDIRNEWARRAGLPERTWDVPPAVTP